MKKKRDLKISECWNRIFGYKGKRVRLKVAYEIPPIKKGERGTIFESSFLRFDNVFLGIHFSRKRELWCFLEEIELI